MMKNKYTIYILLLIITTLAGMWGLPALVKKITYSPEKYPFVYYSSMLEKLCFIDYKNKEFPMTDVEGNVYNTAQFDSLMPMLNYRQLMADGLLPDTIKGHAVTPQLLRVKSVVYKYNPRDFDSPHLGLNVLFEAMPTRVGLKQPDDVFRIKNNVEFIDAETNSVNIEKSERFQNELLKRGYQFPTKWAVGNPNVRKPYDEGYFCFDNNGDLYHIKMVNNRPFVRNTKLSDNINIAEFAIHEVSDKRYYGYLFSKEGDVYIVEGVEGGYNPVKLDIPQLDLKKDEFSIMGNLFYWNIAVTNEEGRSYYVLDASDLKCVDKHYIASSGSKWDVVSKWMFPYYLTFQSSHSNYVKPYFHCNGWYGFVFNFVLAVLAFAFVVNTKERKLFNATFILLTGIAGLLALLLLPDYRRKIN